MESILSDPKRNSQITKLLLPFLLRVTLSVFMTFWLHTIILSDVLSPSLTSLEPNLQGNKMKRHLPETEHSGLMQSEPNLSVEKISNLIDDSNTH